MTSHRLDSAPETVHWGYFGSAIPPALTVASGDAVTVSTRSGRRETLPPDGFGTVAPDHLAILAAVQPRFPSHICTGAVAVEGAFVQPCYAFNSIEHSGPVSGRFALPAGMEGGRCRGSLAS